MLLMWRSVVEDSAQRTMKWQGLRLSDGLSNEVYEIVSSPFPLGLGDPEIR
jgi:hypothetical protein